MEAEEEDDEFDNENFEVDSEVDDASNLPSPNAAEHKDDDEYDDDPNAFEEDSKDFGSQPSPASGSKAISPSKSIRREATFEAESEEEEATSPSKSLRREATFEPESEVEEENLDDDFEAYDGSDVSSPRNTVHAQAEDSKAAEEATAEDERLKEDATERLKEEASRKQASADEKEELDAKQRIEAEAARMAAEARAEAETVRRLAEIRANEEAEVKQRNEEDASRLDAEALPETETARDASEEQARQEEERESRKRSDETITQVIEAEAEAEASRKSAEINVNEEIEVKQINEEEEQRFTAEVEAKEEASRHDAETKAIDRVTSETYKGDMADKDALHGNRGDVSRAVAEAESEEQAPAKVAIVNCKEEEGTHKNEADADEKRLDGEVEAGEIEQRTEDVEVRSSPKPRFADGPPTELFFDNEDESEANALQDEATDDAVEQFSHQRRSLNHGEEGEDDDEDDDLVEEQPRGGSGMLQMSASMPTLRGSLAVARRKIPSHLRAPKRKAAQKLPPPAQVQAWDDRHQLSGVENELLPKKLRAYFSRPQSLPELKEDLARRNHMTEARRRLSLEEVPPTKPTAISADSGAPVIPHKHDFGGHMKDRDNQPRPWNNRWSEGIGILNDGMHPSCRQYFSKDSLFAEAPSQRWRRYQDVEVTRDYSQGAARWKPIIDKEGRPPRFPPIGF